MSADPTSRMLRGSLRHVTVLSHRVRSRFWSADPPRGRDEIGTGEGAAGVSEIYSDVTCATQPRDALSDVSRQTTKDVKPPAPRSSFGRRCRLPGHCAHGTLVFGAARRVGRGL